MCRRPARARYLVRWAAARQEEEQDGKDDNEWWTDSAAVNGWAGRQRRGSRLPEWKMRGWGGGRPGKKERKEKEKLVGLNGL